ncbi:hypothetical protein TYRP_019088, partial [Tyrophagus putrescentiae]
MAAALATVRGFPTSAEHLPLSNRSNSSLFSRPLERRKRDGVAFFLGEPCESVCNQILFHVWCNLTTHRCECLPGYPVNVDNKNCLRAIGIDEPCEFSQSCKYLNRHSECGEGGVCRCSQGYYAKYDESKDTECVAYDSPFHIRIGTTTFDFINNMEFITFFSLTLSFILILILFFLVIKLINKNQQMAKNEQAACERLPPPPPVILSEPQYYPSLESSPHSYRNLSLNEKAKFPFVPTIPFSNLGSRRQSLSSLQSQSSIKSYSSMRSQSSIRNYHCPRPRPEFYRNFRKASSPCDSYTHANNVNQTAFMANHLPSSSMRTKCSNSRCGSGSKVKSEVCLLHNSHKMQEELFVPN